MHLSEIAIYAVRENDGTLVGFSFDAAPGTAEQDRIHKPIDPEDPGGELYLMAYATLAEAEAYTHALELCCGSDNTGWLVRTFAPNLTCVLVDLTHSTCSAFTCEDMRTAHAVALPKDPPAPVYNHAFDIAFSLNSADETGRDVTPQALRNAILDRLASLTDSELLESVGAPWDTYHEETQETGGQA